MGSMNDLFEVNCPLCGEVSGHIDLDTAASYELAPICARCQEHPPADPIEHYPAPCPWCTRQVMLPLTPSKHFMGECMTCRMPIQAWLSVNNSIHDAVYMTVHCEKLFGGPKSAKTEEEPSWEI